MASLMFASGSLWTWAQTQMLQPGTRSLPSNWLFGRTIWPHASGLSRKLASIHCRGIASDAPWPTGLHWSLPQEQHAKMTAWAQMGSGVLRCCRWQSGCWSLVVISQPCRSMATQHYTKQLGRVMAHSVSGFGTAVVSEMDCRMRRAISQLILLTWWATTIYQLGCVLSVQKHGLYPVVFWECRVMPIRQPSELHICNRFVPFILMAEYVQNIVSWRAMKAQEAATTGLRNLWPCMQLGGTSQWREDVEHSATLATKLISC
mmetsp:Transcript_14695/g.28984  ORF Transcript_14695/g.28984 Transcript_14695/m.28984 type:complete len:261 (+) Transcript_14695:348-1130(+)